jgi:hypothetical protein
VGSRHTPNLAGADHVTVHSGPSQFDRHRETRTPNEVVREFEPMSEQAVNQAVEARQQAFQSWVVPRWMSGPQWPAG